MISSDASKLIAGNSAGICYIWTSANQGEEFVPQQELEAHHEQYILKCVLSPDGKYLATCSSDRSCKIWKLLEEEDEFDPYPVAVLAGHGGWVWDCDFTMDSVYCITVSTDTFVRIWKIDKAEVRKTLAGHTKGITCLAFCDGV